MKATISESRPLTFLADEAPGPGVAVEVADGIWWARFPLPFRLNHVNVWILEDAGGWAVVDCGANSPETDSAWRSVERQILRERPVRRLIATHGHTDHVGHAGPFVERHRCTLHITLAEWHACSLRYQQANTAVPETHADFFELHGCTAEEIGAFGDSERLRRYLARPPQSFSRMRGGDALRIGSDDWQVATYGGHSPEHASLYSSQRNVLIAGDQVLPGISPVIGVYPSEPDANPLGEYLDSLDALRDLPDDVVVLPSHGLPYVGLHARTEQLRAHHEHRLDLLFAAAAEPRTARELAESIFARAIREGQARLALAETLAHLNYMQARGMLAGMVVKGRKYFGPGVVNPA